MGEPKRRKPAKREQIEQALEPERRAGRWVMPRLVIPRFDVIRLGWRRSLVARAATIARAA
jgi:hypothetical protein